MTPQSPTLFRFIAALLYDYLVLFSVWMLSIALCLFFETRYQFPLPPWCHAFILIGVAYLLYGVCWRYGGQTLGALAWRFRVVDKGGKGLSWKQTTVRFIVGFFSVPFLGTWQLWALLDPAGLSLVDRLSGTRLVRLA